MKGKEEEAGLERERRRPGPRTRGGAEGVPEQHGTEKKKNGKLDGKWASCCQPITPSPGSSRRAGLGACPRFHVPGSRKRRLEAPPVTRNSGVAAPKTSSCAVTAFFNSAKPACVFLLIPGPPRPRPAVPLCRWCASGHLSRRPRGAPASHRLSNGRLSCELSGATGRTVVLPRPPITGHLAPRVTRRRPHMADVSRLEHVSYYYDRNSSKLERCLCFN